MLVQRWFKACWCWCDLYTQDLCGLNPYSSFRIYIIDSAAGLDIPNQFYIHKRCQLAIECSPPMSLFADRVGNFVFRIGLKKELEMSKNLNINHCVISHISWLRLRYKSCNIELLIEEVFEFECVDLLFWNFEHQSIFTLYIYYDSNARTMSPIYIRNYFKIPVYILK